MCIVSNVSDFYRPIFEPYIWPKPMTPVQPIDPEAWKRLVDGFKKATEAAEVVDAALGNPDCVDPEKKKLMERIEELEKELANRPKWVVKLGSLYWTEDGWESTFQSDAYRFYDKAEARKRATGAARVVRLT